MSPSSSLADAERVLDIDVSVEGFSIEGLANGCLGNLPGSLYLIAESDLKTRTKNGFRT